jgi:acetyl esterase/lipase
VGFSLRARRCLQLVRSLLFVAFAFAACTPTGATTWVEAPDPVDGTRPLTLDLATPSQEGPRPLLLFFHGGGWNIGSLADHHYREKIAEAARRGYVAATVEYRLANLDAAGGGPRFPWPAQSEDVRCAVRYLLSRAEELHLDPTRIGVAGHSAGGQLALMTGLGPRTERLDGTWCPFPDVDFRVRAIVSYAGPGDLRSLYPVTEGWVQGFITRFLALRAGTTPEQAPDAYLDASPVKYLDGARDVPVLLIQGLADTIAPPAVNQGFRDELVARGRRVELLEIDGASHTLDGDAAGDTADAAMWRWFEAELEP